MTQTIREPLVYCAQCERPSAHAAGDILQMCARCVRRAPDAVVALRFQLRAAQRPAVAAVAPSRPRFVRYPEGLTAL